MNAFSSKPSTAQRQESARDAEDESPPHYEAPPDSGTSGENLTTLARHYRRLDRLALKKRKRRFAPIGSPRSHQRLREIERVLTWHHGPVLPDDNAGHEDLHILLSVLKACGKSLEDAMGFIHKWAPWMTAEAANSAYTNGCLTTAYWKADVMAAQLGVTYATRSALRLRTIGACDVPKAEREKFRRAKADAKRKRAKAAKPKKLKPREQAIMRMVGSGGHMGDLARKATRSKLFRDLQNVPLEVRRVVDKLVKSGHLGKRLEHRDRGGKEWFLWREQAAGQRDKRDMSQMSQTKETAAARPLSKNAPRQTPIFIGSNRGADSCVNNPKGDTKKHDLDRVGPVSIEVPSVVVACMVPELPGRRAIAVGAERVKRDGVVIRKGETGGFAGATPPPTHLQRALARAVALQRQQESGGSQ